MCLTDCAIFSRIVTAALFALGLPQLIFGRIDFARRFNSHRGVGRRNPGAAHPSKTFPHPLKKPRSIVVPLIAIIFADEIDNSLPISAVDRVKEMFRVKADLMLRPPKPDEI